MRANERSKYIRAFANAVQRDITQGAGPTCRRLIASIYILRKTLSSMFEERKYFFSSLKLFVRHVWRRVARVRLSTLSAATRMGPSMEFPYTRGARAAEACAFGAGREFMAIPGLSVHYFFSFFHTSKSLRPLFDP